MLDRGTHEDAVLDSSILCWSLTALYWCV